MFLKTITAAAAVTMLTLGAGYAQTNANNAPPYVKPDTMSEQVYDYFADRETGNWRTDEDFQTRWGSASPEDQAMMRDTCTELQKDATLFTDTVQSRCKMITGPTGG